MYSELESATTSLQGLLNLVIGNDPPVVGDLSTIDWRNGP